MEAVAEAAKFPEHMSLRHAELEWLYKAAEDMESVVEVGSFLGRSTFVICSACLGEVFAVDPFDHPHAGGPEHYNLFLRNVGHFWNLRPLRMTSAEAAGNGAIPPLVDMVFIDADHSKEAVLLDTRLWTPRARRMICGHDYDDYGQFGVKEAVDEVFGGRVQRGPDSIWFVNL